MIALAWLAAAFRGRAVPIFRNSHPPACPSVHPCIASHRMASCRACLLSLHYTRPSTHASMQAHTHHPAAAAAAAAAVASMALLVPPRRLVSGSAVGAACHSSSSSSKPACLSSYPPQMSTTINPVARLISSLRQAEPPRKNNRQKRARETSWRSRGRAWAWGCTAHVGPCAHHGEH